MNMSLNDTSKKLAVVFDMDGVLIDSTYYIWESFRQLLAPYGVEVTDDLIKECLGYSLETQIKIWEERFKIKLPPLPEFSEKAAEIEIAMMKESMVKQDLITFLEELKKNKFRLAVGTASQRRRAIQILDLLGVKDYFDAIITANDVTEHKPNPHVYLEAAKKINVEPKSCVVIEDASAGIEAARRAKMKSVGYITKYSSAESLKDANLLIKGFDELSVEKLEELLA
ncbi:MAG: family hydrolase [Candidatus Berkelbacteria bacterium]|nr:family hydrolase [Candidatus Berkelbacteria bacterium]